MEEKKFLLEHTKLFEKEILKRLDDGFIKVYDYINAVKYISPKIYTVVLDSDDESYDFFLSKMVEEEEIYLYKEYLDTVYIDKDIYSIKNIEDKIYVGKYVLDNEEYRFTFSLEKDSRYDDIIKDLYNSYLLSNYRWYGIDKRDINRMYRIKVLSYIDDISLIEGLSVSIEYDLDEDFKFNKSIFWNVEKGVALSKSYLTNLDEIGFKYVLTKEENTDYLIQDDGLIIEDVVSSDNKLIIYSKKDKLYLFNIFKIHDFYKDFFEKYTVSYIHDLKDDINLSYIKKYLELHGINVIDIKKQKEAKKHIYIPNFNEHITKLYIAYIYIRVANIEDYDKLFYVINLLQINLSLYEILVYE